MDKNLKICIYGKRTEKPSMVLRKGKILYRIARLLYVNKVEKDLRDLKESLENGGVNLAVILEIESVKNRRRVVEIGFVEGAYSLYVFEMLKEPKLRFRWRGSKEALIECLKDL